MALNKTSLSLSKQLPFVKSTNLGTSALPTDPVIHHKPLKVQKKIVISYSSISQFKRYGVSTSQRFLSPGLFIKRYDQVRGFLDHTLDLTTAQREVALRILRLWAYYGLVYPKESQITREPGCSKATFWRTVRLLKDVQLVQVVNRFVMRPHAQISNLYRLDRLALAIARYLAEHGLVFRESWAKAHLAMTGQVFWAQLYRTPVATTGPP